MNYTPALEARGVTRREFQVLECLSMGQKPPQIAERLGIALSNVHVLCFRLRQKLKVNTKDPTSCNHPLRAQRRVQAQLEEMYVEARDANPRYRNPNRFPLSRRQLEVMRLRAAKLDWRDIAQRMGISPATAQNTCSTACKRINLHTSGPFRMEVMREWLAKHDPAPHLGVQPDSPMSDPMF